MNTQDLLTITYPEWYRVERETENTIKRLYSFEELEYYLKNNDAYIRRLAIIRIGQLRLISSMVILNTMLESSSESIENKHLLAWTIKSMLSDNKQKNFIFNDLIEKYSGKEPFESLFGIIINDETPSTEFNFITGVQEKINETNKSINKSRQVIDFEMPFSINEWANECFLASSNSIKRFFFNTPSLIYKGFRFIFNKLPRLGVCLFKGTKIAIVTLVFVLGKKLIFDNITKIFKPFSGIHISKKQQPQMFTETAVKNNTITNDLEALKHAEQIAVKKLLESNNFSQLKQNTAKANSKKFNSYARSSTKHLFLSKKINNVLKEVLLTPLKIILLPFRFLYTKRLYFSIILIVVYILSTYTLYGRAITSKYLNIDIKIVQDTFIEKSSNTIQKYWSNLKMKLDFEGIRATAEKIENNNGVLVSDKNYYDKSLENTSEDAKYYRVSSQKGLNLRSAPELNATLATELPLEYNSLVEYLSNSAKDDNGILWYNIKTADGVLGWASARFLTEANN